MKQSSKTGANKSKFVFLIIVQKFSLDVIQALKVQTWQIRQYVRLSICSNNWILSGGCKDTFGIHKNYGNRNEHTGHDKPALIEIYSAQFDVASSCRLADECVQG
jgi:hypothetical protein